MVGRTCGLGLLVLSCTTRAPLGLWFFCFWGFGGKIQSFEVCGLMAEQQESSGSALSVCHT